MRNLLMISLAAIAMSSQAEAPKIPSVPLALAKKDLPAIESSVQASAPVESRQPFDRSELLMTPGVNEIVRISKGHINRISTPFSAPTITTESEAQIEARDNVIYITSYTDTPVTLFITEKNSEDVALSLTLIPKEIPPRDFSLKIESGHANVAMINRRAKAWETAQPYQQMLEDLLRTIALGDIPRGYTLVDHIGSLPACRQTGISVEFGLQTIVGNKLAVHVGLAKNVTNEILEFDEDSCGDWDIAAVAAFPNFALHPGEKTEVYVVQKRNYLEQIKVRRTSLLKGDDNGI